jgi:hypothetical protein
MGALILIVCFMLLGYALGGGVGAMIGLLICCFI